MGAPDDKLRLEVEKLQLEVRAHARSPWKRIETYTSLTTICAAIVGSYIAMTTQTAVYELKIERLRKAEGQVTAQLKAAQSAANTARVERDAMVHARDEAKRAALDLATESSLLESYLENAQAAVATQADDHCQSFRATLASAASQAEALTANAEAALPEPGADGASATPSGSHESEDHLAAGRDALAGGNTRRALMEFRLAARAVGSAPRLPQIPYRIGRALQALLDWTAAEQQFLAALKINPSYRPAKSALANLYLLRGNFAEVAKLVDPDRPLGRRVAELQAQAKACDAGKTDSCARIGISLFYSDGAVEGVNAAEKYLKLGCLNDNQSCRYLRQLAKKRKDNARDRAR